MITAIFHKIKISSAILALAGACLWAPATPGVLAEEISVDQSQSAVIYFLPDFKNFFDPENLTIDLIIKPGSQAANAFDLTISFAPDQLALTAWEYSEKHTWLWLNENTGEEKGVFRLAGGASGEGISTTTAVARLHFQKISGGWTEISFLSAQILAADGLGTNIDTATEIHRILLFK
ncbi:MAG: cohesin domain-containing protein [Planctomycetes bacterium]|jgi:hypothetical protein|nr:cohesin domain-containing protein [Planctomycetota bacterium]